MHRTKWLLMIIVAGLAVILLNGCSTGGNGAPTGEIDPPPDRTEWPGLDKDDSPTSADVDAGDTMEITGYYEDANGLVAPISLRVPYEEGTAKATLAHMVEGGPADELLPAGFRALIPQGTGMTLDIRDDRTAVVDFTEEFVSYNAQDERKILEAITWALTGFDQIDRVTLRLNGEPLTEMPVGGTPVSATLTRAIGINLERVKGIDYGQATPVTLFFQSAADNGYAYFVPVTRLIARTDDVAQAAMAELIKGPMNGGLLGVMPPEAQVLNIDKAEGEDIIRVNLDRGLLTADERAPHESLQSVILSLTESTGTEKVQILVDGSAEVVSTEEQVYDSPVSRPAHVNKIEL